MRFPIYSAAYFLYGKPPEELPHGLLTIPPEVRELIEERRAEYSPEVFAKVEITMLNDETIGWYFSDLGHEVIYRETPRGPEVLAVGYEEVLALKKMMPAEELRKLKREMFYTFVIPAPELADPANPPTPPDSVKPWL
jgi:hypothetical protein